MCRKREMCQQPRSNYGEWPIPSMWVFLLMEHWQRKVFSPFNGVTTAISIDSGKVVFKNCKGYTKMQAKKTIDPQKEHTL